MFRSLPTLAKNAVVLAALVIPSTSMAQATGPDPAEAGTIIFSVDRVFGLNFGVVTREDSGGGISAEDSDTTTEFSLLGRGPAVAGRFLFSTPRLAADFLVAHGFSVGGGIGYVVTSTESERTTTVNGVSDTVKDDGPTVTGFVFAPRAGYLAVFGPHVGLWPRLGITFMAIGSESSDADVTAESSTTVTAFTLEAPLVIMPAPGVMLTLGVTLDRTLSFSTESTVSAGGTTQTTEDTADTTATEFGIQGGLAAFF